MTRVQIPAVKNRWADANKQPSIICLITKAMAFVSHAPQEDDKEPLTFEIQKAMWSEMNTLLFAGLFLAAFSIVLHFLRTPSVFIMLMVLCACYALFQGTRIFHLLVDKGILIVCAECTGSGRFSGHLNDAVYYYDFSEEKDKIAFSLHLSQRNRFFVGKKYAMVFALEDTSDLDNKNFFKGYLVR